MAYYTYMAYAYMSGYTGSLPEPGDKLRVPRHGEAVTVVVQPYYEPYVRHRQWLPIRCTCGCCCSTVVSLGEIIDRLGSGPPS